MDDLKDLSTEEQLVLLRDMTRRLNVLHDAQVVQLKYWFFMLYSEVSKFEIICDFDNSVLTYKVIGLKNVDEFKNNKNFNTLNEYVKFLLGQRFRVKVEYVEEGR